MVKGVDVKKKVLKRKFKKMKEANEMAKKKKKVERLVQQEEASSDEEHPASDDGKPDVNELNGESNDGDGTSTPDVVNFLSKQNFDSLKGRVSDATLKQISSMGFTTMTEIQHRTIEPLLEGRDVLASAKTGSGKTLGFLVPAIELLIKLDWKIHNGTGVMIISPTRELSMQTYGVLSELLEGHPHLTHGLIMGGSNRSTEVEKLAKGISILVATPGRLLDHLQNTKALDVHNLKCLIIDEADRILDIGFEIEMQQILRYLPKRRQTMLFSATHTPKVDELVRQALESNPLKVDVQSKEERATVEGLEQGYVVCPSERRFLLLFTFLKKNKGKKIMVFFSSCNSVKFHYELLNYIDLKVECIHGKQKQQKRTTTFFEFCRAESGILLCTDVAARGLDIPAVDWIIQFDPPDEPREYIHRVGRTARGKDGTGNALIILRPEELGFLRYLRQAKVVLNEFDFSWNKVANIQSQLEELIGKNYYLNKSAKEAYKSYVRAYDSHSLKEIFDVGGLELISVAKSFGFTVPPFVELPIAHKNRAEVRNKLNGAGYKKRKQLSFTQKKKHHG
ncbi:unnamed protein product, partial [Mesorhabditis belari]|uniref:ATP-dependent RNA helicase n=1 Tax=Mesorhabditis belari TaxID=2138241 RepID=A0AAF3F2E9_9BILA